MTDRKRPILRLRFDKSEADEHVQARRLTTIVEAKKQTRKIEREKC